MRRKAVRHRLLLALCLLLFQGQLLAVSSLGCLHDGGRGNGSPGDCPLHGGLADGGAAAAQSGNGSSGDDGPLDCPKCVLSLGLGHLVQPAVPTLSAPLPARGNAPLPARHFYRFTPDPFFRPPIAAAA
jgi:hypothetical protein